MSNPVNGASEHSQVSVPQMSTAERVSGVSGTSERTLPVLAFVLTQIEKDGDWKLLILIPYFFIKTAYVMFESNCM